MTTKCKGCGLDILDGEYCQVCQVGLSGDDPVLCAKCGCMMKLNDGMEWPDDGVPIMCWGCQHEEIGRLQTVIEQMGATASPDKGT